MIWAAPSIYEYEKSTGFMGTIEIEHKRIL